MDLGRPGLAQHPDQRPLGVAPHDGVVDDDEALAPDDLAQRVELEPDAELPDRLGRLDEGPADVGVLDQALAVGDAGLLGVADRRGRPRLRGGDDEVGIDRVLPGQGAAHLDPGLVDDPAADRRVGPGQVDVLEDAPRRGRPGRTVVERSPPSSMAMSSPGSTSRMNDAPTMSSAAVSEATTQPRSSRPMTSGRMPWGSRAAYEGLLVHEDEAEGAAQPGQHLEGRALQASGRGRRRAGR